MAAHETRIVTKREVGPAAHAIECATPSGFTAEPGQFVLIRATIDGERVGRHYTISSPVVDDTFEVTVEAAPNGTLSRWLARQPVGRSLHVEGPFGRVHYEPFDRCVVLAGGPGVGAAVGIAERARSEGRGVELLYAGDTVLHSDRLAELARGGGAVFVVSGPLDRAVEALDLSGRPPVFVFGFRGFVDDVVASLTDRGYPAEDLRVENFGPRERS